MFNFGDLFVLFSCAFFCVRVLARFVPLLFFIGYSLLFTPGVVWGALGGLRPLLGGPGDTPPVRTFLSVLGPSRGLLPPFQGGLGGFYVL